MCQKDFWITNITNMNVCLSDLNLTVKAFHSVNLLDRKHYHYTIEQLELSRKTGSIAKRKNKIVVRDNAPEVITKNIAFLKESYIPDRRKSTYEIRNEKYEELSITDEQFAEENADLADLDTKPIISKE
jgi:hypothetical protein